MSVNTTSFKIAQYILMFLVAILCIGIVAWILSGGDKSDTHDASADNIIQITDARN